MRSRSRQVSSARLRDASNNLLPVIVLFVLNELEDVLSDLLNRLDEFGLARVALV